MPKRPNRYATTLMGHGVCAQKRSMPLPRVSRVVSPLPPSPPSPSPEELRRQAELERELKMARDLQQGLLLEAAPHLPGWEISAVSIPALDLGGDLYDFLPLRKGEHGIMIGDVSGKGLAAALRMAVARTVFRYAARRGESPGLTLAAVNRGVLSEIPQGMVTMLYVTLDLNAGQLCLANAGHTFPLLINGQVTELELSGLPLGVDGDSDYEETSALIAHGDTVFFYTDGVVEALNASEEVFGFEHLQEVLATLADLKPRAMMSRLLHELRAWSGGSLKSDDVTMVVIRRRLAHLYAELHSIVYDVLGKERTVPFWAELATEGLLPVTEDNADQWIEALPAITRYAQSRFGRGLARELQQQIRLAIEDYRM